jgi:uncharacterized protein
MSSPFPCPSVAPRRGRRPRQRVLAATLLGSLSLGLGLVLPALPTAAAVAPSLLSDERVRLDFDGSLADSSGHGRDASLLSSAAPSSSEKYTEGIAGKAAEFDGATALTLGNDAALLPESMTLSFWFKPDGTMGSSEQIFAWNKREYNTDGWYLSSEGSGIPLALSVGTGSSQPYKVSVRGSRDAFFPKDRFTHVVITFDAASHEVQIYRNGRRQSTQIDYAVGSDSPGRIKATANTQSTLGFNGPVYKGAFLKGALDEYRVFGRAGGDADAVALYAEHEPDFTTRTVAQEDVDALKLASSAAASFRLSTTGAQGTALEWSSSDPAITVDGETATVHRGAEDREVTLTVQGSYAGSAVVSRTFTVVVRAAAATAADEVYSSAGLSEVSLGDEYLVNANEQTVKYLLSLDPDRLLSGFMTEAGLTPQAKPYTGWEALTGTRFSGHFGGHYLSALSQAYATTEDEGTRAQLLAKITTMVEGLEKAQKAYAIKDPTNAGYVAPFPVSYLPSGKDGLLVPFYNLHKVLAGLLDAQRYAPGAIGDRALAVADGFGTWLDGFATRYNNPQALLRTEYGGMNEALYRLYEITHKSEHRKAAEAFDEVSLFRSLAQGKDVLDGLHANTTIPKLTGALKRYTVLTQNPELEATLTESERADLDMYRQAAENFWQMVVDDHTYANGGNSQSEHFHAADTLFEYANNGVATGYGENSTSEGCNEYNMLKLSAALFSLTGEVKYADYYEETFLNTIVASQDPDTGMVTYFQPMTAGYSKTFGHPEGEFWCDHGTGIESFTKLADGIYFTRGNDVVVNRFTPSTLVDDQRGLKLVQSGEVPSQDTVTFTVQDAPGATLRSGTRLKLRVPSWAASAPEVRLNGQRLDLSAVAGYLSVPVKTGDTVEYMLRAGLRVVADEQNPNWVALKYGPVLLATELNRDRVGESYIAGVLVRMGTRDASADATVTVASADDFRADPSLRIQRVKDAHGVTGNAAMRFELAGAGAEPGRTLEPYFSLHEARYAVYMTLVEPDSEAAQAAILKKKQQLRDQETTVDQLTSFDNNNSEAGKNYAYNRSGVGVWKGRAFRDGEVSADAWFSYELAVDQSAQKNYLCVDYYGGDVGRTFDVLISGQLFKHEAVTDRHGAEDFYQQCDEIPAQLVAEAKDKLDSNGEVLLDAQGHAIKVVTVRFQGNGKSNVGGVFGVYTRTSVEYDTRAQLSVLEAAPGTVAPGLAEGVHEYEVSVPAGTASVALTLRPAVGSGLVYVDGVLIDDAQPRIASLGSGAAAAKAGGSGDALRTLAVRAVAQDHSTSAEYTVRVVREAVEPSASSTEATPSGGGTTTPTTGTTPTNGGTTNPTSGTDGTDTPSTGGSTAGTGGTTPPASSVPGGSAGSNGTGGNGAPSSSAAGDPGSAGGSSSSPSLSSHAAGPGSTQGQDGGQEPSEEAGLAATGAVVVPLALLAALLLGCGAWLMRRGASRRHG